MSDELLTTAEVSELTGIPRNTLLTGRGMPSATVNGMGGPGNQSLWSVQTVLGLGFARRLRRDGVPTKEAAHAMRFIEGLTFREMRDSFARGARFIGVIFPIGLVVPRLVTERSWDSDDVTAARLFRPDLDVRLYDMQDLFGRLTERIKSMRAAQRSREGRRQQGERERQEGTWHAFS